MNRITRAVLVVLAATLPPTRVVAICAAGWDRVIMAGASHGATTAARFAKHQRVDRVVMFCGPRDQLETWQGLPSATPANRYFGFSHVLDGGWTGHHYDRSWALPGLNEFGAIVNVEHAAPPYGNTRRLITDADVKKDARRAHSSVVPGGAAVKDAAGRFIHEDVWRYLFTHPVEQVGQPVSHDPNCSPAMNRPIRAILHDTTWACSFDGKAFGERYKAAETRSPENQVFQFMTTQSLRYMNKEHTATGYLWIPPACRCSSSCVAAPQRCTAIVWC